MRTVTLEEAKANLSELVSAAANGEAFVIATDGTPLVKVVPVEVSPPATRPVQRLGFMRGEITIPDDFDTMDQEEIERLFGVRD